jgi:hypothetical protein
MKKKLLRAIINLIEDLKSSQREDAIRADERKRIFKFFDGSESLTDYPFVVTHFNDRNKDGDPSLYSGDDLRKILKDGVL